MAAREFPWQRWVFRGLRGIRRETPATVEHKRTIAFEGNNANVIFWFRSLPVGGPGAAGEQKDELYAISIWPNSHPGQEWYFRHGDLYAILQEFEDAYKNPETRSTFEYSFINPTMRGGSRRRRQKKRSRKTKKNGRTTTRISCGFN